MFKLEILDSRAMFSGSVWSSIDTTNLNSEIGIEDSSGTVETGVRAAASNPKSPVAVAIDAPNELPVVLPDGRIQSNENSTVTPTEGARLESSYASLQELRERGFAVDWNASSPNGRDVADQVARD